MKKYYIITLALLLSVSTCFAAKSATEPSKDLQVGSIQENSGSYISAASAKFMKQDYKGAITNLDEAIKISPNNPQLYLNRGFVKHILLDYKGALEDYNRAIAINPNFAFGYNNRGALKVSMNDTKGAMEDYEKALSLNPRYSDVYYNRGNLKYMLNDNKGALADYDMAIKYNPKDSEAYNNRGVVKKRMNFNIGALSDYSQAIALNPNDSIAYSNRGKLKKLYFDNEGAAIDLNKAVELAENQVFIKNVKPLLSNQSYIAAIPSVKGVTYNNTELKTATKIKEQQSDKLAMSIQPSSRTEKPLQKATQPSGVTQQKDVKTVGSVNSKSGATVLSAGVGKVVPPNIPDIRTSPVTKNATTNTKLAESYYIRGLQKCVLRDMQGAVADLDKAIANNPNYADAYFYRGAIKKELGDKEGFRKDYTTAIKINPGLQQYNDTNALSMVQ